MHPWCHHRLTHLTDSYEIAWHEITYPFILYKLLIRARDPDTLENEARWSSSNTKLKYNTVLYFTPGYQTFSSIARCKCTTFVFSSPFSFSHGQKLAPLCLSSDINATRKPLIWDTGFDFFSVFFFSLSSCNLPTFLLNSKIKGLRCWKLQDQVFHYCVATGQLIKANGT